MNAPAIINTATAVPAFTLAQAEAVEAVARAGRANPGGSTRINHFNVLLEALAMQDLLAGVEIEASDEALWQAIKDSGAGPDYYAAIRSVGL